MNDFNPLIGSTAAQTNQNLVGLTALMSGLLKSIAPKLEAKIEVAMAQQLAISQVKEQLIAWLNATKQQYENGFCQPAVNQSQQCQQQASSVSDSDGISGAGDHRDASPTDTSADTSAAAVVAIDIEQLSAILTNAAPQHGIVVDFNQAKQRAKANRMANEVASGIASEQYVQPCEAKQPSIADSEATITELLANLLDTETYNVQSLNEICEQTEGLVSVSEMVHNLVIAEYQQTKREHTR